MEMLTTKETAEILKLKPETVRNYFREGRIKAQKLGNQWRTREAWLEEFLDREASDKDPLRHDNDQATDTDTTDTDREKQNNSSERTNPKENQQSNNSNDEEHPKWLKNELSDFEIHD